MNTARTLLTLASFTLLIFAAAAQPPDAPPPGPPPGHDAPPPPPPHRDGGPPPPPPHDLFAPPPPPPGDKLAPPPPGDGRRGRPDFMREADVNHDGKITLQELQTARPGMTQERFNRFDQNGDGVLSHDDGPPRGGPGRDGRGPGGREGRPGGLSDEQRAEFMQSLDDMLKHDANEDGQVTFAEVSAAKPGYPEHNFRRVDVNRDGALTEDDKQLLASVGLGQPGDGQPGDGQPADDQRGPGREGRRGGRIMERLATADTNGDAKISFDEAHAAMPRLDEKMFKWYDTNRDSFLTPEDRQGAPGGERGPRPQL